MRSGMKNLAPLICAVGIAAVAGALGTSLSSAQVWPTNNVKQKMLAGEKIVKKTETNSPIIWKSRSLLPSPLRIDGVILSEYR